MKEKLTMGFGPSILAAVVFTNLLVPSECFVGRFLLSDRSGFCFQPTFCLFCFFQVTVPLLAFFGIRLHLELFCPCLASFFSLFPFEPHRFLLKTLPPANPSGELPVSGHASKEPAFRQPPVNLERGLRLSVLAENLTLVLSTHLSPHNCL